jgi:drug/metabolite transporter (DMT)-like permease
MLLVTTLIWGATFGIGKFLVDAGIAPMAVVAWRFALATPLFLLLFGRRVTLRPSRTTIIGGLSLGILLYAGFGLQTAGLGITSSSRSGFITALYVVFTPILQLATTRRAPSRNVVLGIIIVLAGLWALTAPDGTLAGLLDPWASGGFNRGDLFTLLCAFIFAAYIVLLDGLSTSTAEGRPAEIETLTFLQLGVVAIVATAHVGVLAATGSLDGRWTMPAQIAPWGGILYLALFASVVSTYWQTRYQGGTTPSRAAVIYTLESVFAAIIGAIALGEHLTPLAIGGGALIVTGLLVTTSLRLRRSGDAAAQT